MASYQDITVKSGTGAEALFVADECNHSAWFRLADLDKFGAEEPDVPYMATCEDCEVFPGDTRRQWRRVWVKV